MKLEARVVGVVSVESDGHEWHEGSGSEQVGALDLVFCDWPQPPHDPGFASHLPSPHFCVSLGKQLHFSGPCVFSSGHCSAG